MNIIKRVTSKDVRGFFIDSKELVEKARNIHQLNPVSTSALGRLLSTTSLMGSMMKSKKEYLTVKVDGDGPMRGMLVSSDFNGNVKGYVYNNDFIGYARYDGKIDVGGAIGNGTLTVMQDLGLKEPYNSTTPLFTGEIGDDLAYYFSNSQQTPSAVGVGVLLDKDTAKVKNSGAFIVQLLPNASDESKEILMDNISKITAVTDELSNGGIDSLIQKVFKDLDYNIVEEAKVDYLCNCSKARVKKVIQALSKNDLEDILNDNEDIEINCHFCDKKYIFTIEELRNFYKTSLL